MPYPNPAPILSFLHLCTTEKNSVGEKQLTKRYGKWRQILKNDGNLRDSLQSVGVRGLKEFGYEPLRPLAKSGDHVAGKQSCDWGAIKECGGMVSGRGDAFVVTFVDWLIDWLID